jgi:hypothetical protein
MGILIWRPQPRPRMRWCTVLVVTLMAVSAAQAQASLPENRVYEQVSPEFKAGYPVFSERLNAFALNGDSAKFVSIGAFDGSGESFALNPYVARRTTSGWVTSALFPPETNNECWVGLEQMDAELSRFEYLVEPGVTSRECDTSPTTAIGEREPDGSLLQFTPAMTTEGGVAFGPGSIVGASTDLSHIIMKYQDPPPAHIFPGDETQEGDQLVEITEGQAQLVGVNEQGRQITRYCSVDLGGGGGAFDAVSQPNASNVFFSTQINSSSHCPTVATAPVQLFDRVDGEVTLTISKPLAQDCTEEPCKAAAKATPKDAIFQGASESGEKVYFTTTQPLVNEDKNSSNDLYEATIGVDESGEPMVTGLTMISHDANPNQAADVEPSVSTISSDGSHVYFVARGVLTAGANSEGETAVEGAENLYVYNGAYTPGTTSFIAELCSKHELSGDISDADCVSTSAESDSSLWSLGSEKREAQTTRDGQFFAFSTYAQLTHTGTGADADASRDVYRYDAETSGLQRVSLGESGSSGNGNGEGLDANIAPVQDRGALQEQFELGTRAMSEDGSTIVFTSTEPLSPNATNGLQNVYVWHEGNIGLISSGSASEADVEPAITPSGQDIFFSTSAGLVEGDTDGLRDIYDARIDGGFPLAAEANEECSGDACQGPLSPPTQVSVPGSVTHEAGENLPVAKPKATKPKPKVKPKSKARRKSTATRRKKRQVKAKRSARRRTLAHKGIMTRSGRS